MNNRLDEYKKIRKKILELYYKIYDISFNDCIHHSETLALDDLYSQYFRLNSSDYLFELVNELLSRNEKLDSSLRFELLRIATRGKRESDIPKELESDYNKSKINCEKAYKIAVNKNDCNYISEPLIELINLKKQLFNYKNGKSIYDNILNFREEGTNQIFYDKLYDRVKKSVLPLYKDCLNNSKFQNVKFVSSVENEIKMINYFAKKFGFDFSRGSFFSGDSTFMDNYGNSDVRISLSYDSNDALNTLYRGIHEIGHAMYEMQVSTDLNETLSWGGASTALHESQAKLFENNIAHSEEFWLKNFNQFLNFIDLKNISLDSILSQLYNVNNNCLRINSDELSYAIHILIRYEIEKEIFNSNLKFREIKMLWNDLYKNYMDLTFDSDTSGILQDPHWFIGDFGYFPTYVLGSAYACQIYDRMNNDLSISKSILNDNYEKINHWLKVNLHQYGSTDFPKNIFEKCVGSEFNSEHYIDYLVKKYGR